MQLAKGLEFRAVAVMACDDEVIQLEECIEGVGDDADFQEVYESRHRIRVRLMSAFSGKADSLCSLRDFQFLTRSRHFGRVCRVQE
jgi:hypothetical protein